MDMEEASDTVTPAQQQALRAETIQTTKADERAKIGRRKRNTT